MSDVLSDPSQLRCLIEQLPEANYALLKYLSQFLASFATNSENKDAVDVSMTFAPFVLRAEAVVDDVSTRHLE